ncbi:MAG: HPr family phosphocarrier protein [Rhodospirillaceae bacterium]|nr:MAG: HPr family phosphocarrier protein [Rhodospirillaceae bacterium]
MTPQTKKDRTLIICNERGLHARAAAKFVKLAGEFEAVLTVEKDGQSVDGRSIMGLMMLAAGIGTTIHVAGKGTQASAALDAVEALIADKFGEDC